MRQDFTYCPSGGGLGQVAGVAESGRPNPSYSTGYTYNAAGERETATCATPQGTSKWRYADYAAVGDPTSPTRAFQTLPRLDRASGAPTAEEMHYVYDTSGRVMEATFAQTPEAGYVPTSGGTWYRAPDGTEHLPSRRARAHYAYDGGGRVKSTAYVWDAWNGSSYITTPILANECDYELSGLSRGLKTASRSYRGNAQNAWSLERTETYGYDARNDQLLSASYGDGLPDAAQSWTYDAAGNRASDSLQPGAMRRAEHSARCPK